MEHFAEIQMPRAASAPIDRIDALVVESLVRAGSPEVRSALAERRLVRTVAEWAPGTGIDVVLRAAARGGRVHAEIRPLGEVHPGWRRDVAGALEGLATLERRRLPVGGGGPRQLAELERDPARARRRTEDVIPLRETQPLGAADVVWPTASRDASLELISVLRSAPGSFVRVLMAPPSDFERRMLIEEMSATWDRLSHPDFDTYLGSPVLARTL
ncbi:hypothetical protein AB2L57_09595 [Microbacterium sp. HA-8]|uniref:hypothetical protein n=1 Tax=Microbacterium sp. HA-8 TaxID=3234200 RepID=UPI0038F681B4